MFARWSWFQPSVVCLLGIVLLGLGLRTYHYVGNPPLWHDEAAQVMNILNKSFGEQLGPLYYSEAAPPLFMWAEKAIVLVLGDGPMALRLLPWLASCLAFAGLLWIGWRVLSWAALLWLGLLFACSDRLLWHCCEAKPYAVDVLIAVGLLATRVRPWLSPIPFVEASGCCSPPYEGGVGGVGVGVAVFSNPPQPPLRKGGIKQFILRRTVLWQSREQAATEENLGGWLLLYACLSPVLVWLSFPACFLLGGLALCLLPAVWRQRSPRLLTGYGVFLLVLGVSFLLLLGPIRAQRAERLMACWRDFFPSWDQPWHVPLQLGQRLTEVFRYSCEPIGNVLCALATVGGVLLWRQGQQRLLAFLVFPWVLAASAWLLGQYVIGPLRVVVFLAPSALILIAAGTPPVLAWLRERTGMLGPTVLIGLLLFPLLQAGFRLAVPWKRLDSAEPAAFVLGQRQPHEAVVGTLWEQAYYFRALGTAYRPLAPLDDEPPSLPPTAALDDGGDGFVKAFWLLGNAQPVDPGGCLGALPPGGAWVADQRYRFRNITVLHVRRMSKQEGSGVRGQGSGVRGPYLIADLRLKKIENFSPLHSDP